MYLSEEQKAVVDRELPRKELSIYTAVALARKDVAAGRYESAVSRLRVDADKIRPFSPELYAVIYDTLPSWGEFMCHEEVMTPR